MADETLNDLAHKIRQALFEAEDAYPNSEPLKALHRRLGRLADYVHARRDLFELTIEQADAIREPRAGGGTPKT